MVPNTNAITTLKKHDVQYTHPSFSIVMCNCSVKINCKTYLHWCENNVVVVFFFLCVFCMVLWRRQIHVCTVSHFSSVVIY